MRRGGGIGVMRGGRVGTHTHSALSEPSHAQLRVRASRPPSACSRAGAVTLMSGDLSRCSSDLSILRDQQASRRWLGLGLGLRLRLARASPSPNPSQAMRRVVGYCPQHDALEGLLSACETLRMYAAHQARAP